MYCLKRGKERAGLPKTRSTKVPFILAMPWKAASHGMTTDAMTENVDVSGNFDMILGPFLASFLNPTRAV